LGVNEQILIKLYEKEKGIRKNLEESKKSKAEKPIAKPINISSFIFTPQKLAFFLIVILIISGLIYLYQEIGSFSDVPRLIVLNPEGDINIEGNSLSIEGITEKDARLFINDQPILVNDDGKFKENITLQKGINTVSLRAVNKFDKETQKIITIQSNQEGIDFNNSGMANNEDNQENQENSGSLDEIKLELKVDPGPVWLSVEADGNLVFSGTMLSGAIQSFSAKEKIVVNSGKASSTFVKFNGKDIGSLSKDSGAVRGVTFTKGTKY